MTQHPSTDMRTRYLRGLLDSRQFLEVDDHLAACAECREAMAPSPARAAAALVDSITGEHIPYERMEAHVDGALDYAEIGDHIDICPMCAEELDDLRAASRVDSRRPWMYGAAAAALLVMIGTAAVLLRKPEIAVPAHPPFVVSRPPLPPQVATQPALDPTLAPVLSQLAAGVLPSAALVEQFQLQPERVRGGEGLADARAILAPLGVVEDHRPLFRWTSRPGTSYVVEVFDGSYRRIAHSPQLRKDRWQPPASLPRGAILSWQVRARRGDEEIVAPAPPAPPAQFRIIDRDAFAELEAARARHAHLALGLIYAREGAIEPAIEELTLAQKERPDVADIRAALTTLRRYHPAPTTTNPPQ